MSELSSWRDLLRIIISDSSERERIAQQIDLHPLTLTRWVQGTSVPRPSNLRQLLQVLSPDVRTQFTQLLGHAFPGESLSVQAPVTGLDTRFIMEVHTMRETTPERFHFYGITHLILQHALRLLDPGRIGLSMTVIKCTPPSADGKIHSLREQVSQGTFSGERNVQEQSLFLGAESLAGDVVSKCRPQVVALSLVTDAMLWATSPLAERGSMMGCPLLYANRVAGCLVFVSLQPDLFLSPARRSLVEDITRLVTLALKPEEFFPAEAIELFLMPPPAIQRRLFVSFRQRVAHMMQEASQNGSLLTITQAEERIWQQLEAELIETSRQPFSRETS